MQIWFAALTFLHSLRWHAGAWLVRPGQGQPGDTLAQGRANASISFQQHLTGLSKNLMKLYVCVNLWKHIWATLWYPTYLHFHTLASEEGNSETDAGDSSNKNYNAKQQNDQNYSLLYDQLFTSMVELMSLATSPVCFFVNLCAGFLCAAGVSFARWRDGRWICLCGAAVDGADAFVKEVPWRTRWTSSTTVECVGQEKNLAEVAQRIFVPWSKAIDWCLEIRWLSLIDDMYIYIHFGICVHIEIDVYRV